MKKKAVKTSQQIYKQKYHISKNQLTINFNGSQNKPEAKTLHTANSRQPVY